MRETKLILTYRGQRIVWDGTQLCVSTPETLEPASQQLLCEILESACHHMEDARRRMTEWAEVANV